MLLGGCQGLVYGSSLFFGDVVLIDCCCSSMEIVAKDDISMAHPTPKKPRLLCQDASDLHRVRLDDVQVKIAMTRDNRDRIRCQLLLWAKDTKLGFINHIYATPPGNIDPTVIFVDCVSIAIE